MAKPKDKPVYSFIRKGNHLVPELDYDARALEGVQQGQRVQVEIREWRNKDRLRAYWSMMHEAVDGTGASVSAEKLHEVAKLETGMVELIRLPGGVTVAIPASVALDKMGEAEFIAFFRAVEEWLARTYGFVNEQHSPVVGEPGGGTSETPAAAGPNSYRARGEAA